MADIKLIKTPAVMTRISPTKDGGFGIGFHTSEITEPEERANILAMYDKFGWLIFADHAVNEIPRENPDRAAGAKTQSERIRAVLYRLFEHKKPNITFQEFYDRHTEAYITRIKEELPQNENPT